MCVCQRKMPTKDKEIEDTKEKEDNLKTPVFEKAEGGFLHISLWT